MRWIVPLVLMLAVTLAIAAGFLTPARATVQEDSCLEPDIEYPVPCDDDED